MEQNKVNLVRLCGVAEGEAFFSHESFGRKYYTFKLQILRLSGAADRINVLCTGDVFEQCAPLIGRTVELEGEVRSFNNKSGVGSRLVITVLAERLWRSADEHRNEVSLRGTLCKPPIFRETPFGREICDVILAVSRRYGRADYLPCIIWGKDAHAVSSLGEGAALRIEGRLQSRIYIKKENGAETERTAYEVSAVSVEF